MADQNPFRADGGTAGKGAKPWPQLRPAAPAGHASKGIVLGFPSYSAACKRIVPIFFATGAAIEWFMINVQIGEANFYEVAKKKEAQKRERGDRGVAQKMAGDMLGGGGGSDGEAE